MVIPSQALENKEGVETRRQIPSGKRYSPAYKLERGRESDSEMHNRLVGGSIPPRPTIIVKSDELFLNKKIVQFFSTVEGSIDQTQ